jgi:hypothetical protein
MDNPEIDSDGNKRWYGTQRRLHRVDGPAVEHVSGDQFWFLHGKFHRDDGPAVIYTNGTKFWYLNDNCLVFDKWIYEVDMSDEDKVMMKLKYG